MYKGFTFKLDEFKAYRLTTSTTYYVVGNNIIHEEKKLIHSTLEEYLSPNGSLSASKIEADWFPNIEADVFLSHSHKDEHEVLEFAGYLKSKGLIPFVDSTVWKYSDDLLRDINNQYSFKKSEEDGSTTYYYNRCNYAATQVNMILNCALQKMIDTTECVIFLDTPNSMATKDVEKSSGKTNSAWIYSELLTTKLIEKHKPNRNMKSFFSLDESVEERNSLNMEYEVDFSNLKKLSMDALKVAARNRYGKNILDCLYLGFV